MKILLCILCAAALSAQGPSSIPGGGGAGGTAGPSGPTGPAGTVVVSGGGGITIDTPAIQAAANTVHAAGGGQIWLPAGTYLSNATVTLYSNTTVSGPGASAILKAVAPNKTSLSANCTGGSSSCTVASATGFAIGQSVLIADDNAQGHATGAGATVTNISGIAGGVITFTGTTTQTYTTAAHAFILIGFPFFTTANPSSNVVLQNFAMLGPAVSAPDSNYYSFLIAQTFLNFCTSCVQQGLTATNSLSDGLLINHSLYNGITGNVTSNGNGAGIHLSATSTHAFVSGNTVNSNLDSGITFSDNNLGQQIIGNHVFGNGVGIGGIDNSGTGGGGTGDIQNSIIGNDIENSQSDGIRCNSTNGLTISGNTILNNGQLGSGPRNGIYLNSCSRTTITGNLVSDTQGSPTQAYGIQEDGSGDFNVITGNQALNNITAQIALIGAHSVRFDSDTSTLASCTTNKVYASPNGSTGVANCRALVGADLPKVPGIFTGGGTASNSQAIVTNQNKVYGWPIDNTITTTQVSYTITTADNTANLYDIGIYNATGTLVAHIGATAGTSFAPTGSNSQFTKSWTGGAATLTPGNYYLGFTTNCASACAALTSSSSSAITYQAGNVGSSSGGVLLGSFSPSDAITQSNIPVWWIH